MKNLLIESWAKRIDTSVQDVLDESNMNVNESSFEHEKTILPRVKEFLYGMRDYERNNNTENILFEVLRYIPDDALNEVVNQIEKEGNMLAKDDSDKKWMLGFVNAVKGLNNRDTQTQETPIDN